MTVLSDFSMHINLFGQKFRGGHGSPGFPSSAAYVSKKYALVNIAAFGKKKVAKVEHTIIGGMLIC